MLVGGIQVFFDTDWSAPFEDQHSGMCVLSLRLITTVICNYNNYYTHALSPYADNPKHRYMECVRLQDSTRGGKEIPKRTSVGSLLDEVCNTHQLTHPYLLNRGSH